MSEPTDLKENAPVLQFGDLPAWGQDDLPDPLPFNFRNVLRTIGPGAILLAGSIGGGEWLVGPTIAVKYGPSILWIATAAIFLQLMFNLEAIRYTLYTGEPILVGIMRLKPGSKFWSSFYVFLTIAQLGVPALAAGCASVLFASLAGHMAGDADTATLQYISYGVILFTVGMLFSGKTIERMLEYVSWVMVAFIFTFLFVVNIMFVPFSHWMETLTGFFTFGSIPDSPDLFLLATFAATAGSGGVGNLVISNWFRDKGFGMGGKVGAITSAFSSSESTITGVGKVFPITTENLRRWKNWWKYVCADQVVLWGMGCFVGMFLNVNIAMFVTPEGSDVEGMAAGAFQARYMADQLWSGFWLLALLNGFWVFFSTHLGNTDVLIRTVTDILWVASPRIRERTRSISKLYYGLLIILTIWGMFAINWGNALDLFKILGAVACPILAIAAAQILRVNTTLLPKEIRPPL